MYNDLISDGICFFCASISRVGEKCPAHDWNLIWIGRYSSQEWGSVTGVPSKCGTKSTPFSDTVLDRIITELRPELPYLIIPVTRPTWSKLSGLAYQYVYTYMYTHSSLVSTSARLTYMYMQSVCLPLILAAA